MIHHHLKSCLTMAILAFFTTGAFAGISPGTEIKRQQKDFAVFRKGIFSIESRLDRRISMDSIQRVLSATEAEFSNKVLTPIEEYKLYARCINLVQSGHTQVSPTNAVLKEYVLKAKSLPFDLVMVNRHLYVAGYAKATKKSKKAPASRKKTTNQLPVGAEIIAIDEQTIPQWMDKIGQFIGSDEDEPVFEYFIAGYVFDFYRFLATEEHSEYLEVDYVVKHDTLRQSIKLTYPPIKVIQDRFKAIEQQQKKDRKSFGKFKMMGNVGYFRFPSFQDAHGRLYSEFLEKSFKKIKKKKGVELIVIDVRGNGGGNIQTELMSYFLKEPQIVGSYTIDKRLRMGERKHLKKNEEPFRRYKKNMRQFKRFARKHPDFHGQLVTYPIDTNLIFKGHVVVLTDEATFSAASLLASQLKTLCSAQIMGSRAGGSFYVCNAGTLTFKLPHSKISFILNPNTCSSTLDPTAVDPHIKDVDLEIVPDYDPKASNYRKNWEGVVKTAIQKAK